MRGGMTMLRIATFNVLFGQARGSGRLLIHSRKSSHLHSIGRHHTHEVDPGGNR